MCRHESLSLPHLIISTIGNRYYIPILEVRKLRPREIRKLQMITQMITYKELSSEFTKAGART